MSSKKTDIRSSTQPTLFAEPPTESILGRQHAEVIREALRRSIKSCKDGNRNFIAYQMSELLGQVVTVPQLDSWTRESDDDARHVPAELLAGFMAVTRSIEPLKALAELVGCEVIDAEDARLLAWARAEDDAAEARIKAERAKPSRVRYFSEREGRR